MKRLAILGLAILVCFGAVNIATAKPGKKFETRVSIGTERENGNVIAFKGNVRSSKERCEIGRVVRIIKRGDGEIGRARSDQRGRYRVAFGGEDEYAENGRYFAKASPKFLNKSGNTRLCKVGKSRTITVG
ncbi:hypothetical protein HJD18_01845 [Thermoleophilia bacterium SCSIO 60948]|nr:hypothetical protein HJD18_01845 [Thermoleophilia bacterium SCSIO 60948]